jgi:gliding motility-associated-like protein
LVTATNIAANSITFSWPPVSGATSYEVSVNGGANQPPSSGATGTSHTITGLNPMQTVNITVYALGTLACQKSNASATATTLTDEIFIPNVFSPNGDNKNDVLYVYGNVIQSLRMQVFNQWGEKVFETSDKNTGWNGSYKGKQQPVGVYVYAVRIVTTGGQTIDKKGSITLIR